MLLSAKLEMMDAPNPIFNPHHHRQRYTMSVLIAIATAHNSTREIGQRIAARLGTHVASPIEVRDASTIPAGGIAPYSAVILGSAVHAQSWLSAARKLAHTERVELAKRPVWAFSVGVPDTEAHATAEEAKLAGDVRRQIPALRSHVLFKGKVEKDHIPWPANLIFNWFPNLWRFGDFVEWEKVDAWADEVGKDLKVVVGEGRI